MIAACPKCAARYRIDRDKMRPEGVRLRCAKCEAIFRVRAPAGAPGAEARPEVVAPAPETRAPAPAAAAPAPAPAAPGPDAPLVLIGTPDDEIGKDLTAALAGWGARTAVVSDGVEAMLEIQRQLPAAIVLAATLPRMFGFQICEIVKRNDSLREIGVVLLGSIHHKDRYRRPPGELYGADAYVEEPDLPDALLPTLQRMGLPLRGAGPASAPAPAPREPTPPASVAPVRPASIDPPARAPQPTPAPDDGLGEARSKAERLARIIVSDIVLYNEEKFAAAVAAGNVVETMTPDLEEGRSLFNDRIDAAVRAERDYLADELLRVAGTRGVK